jgi:uncharacterized membrane protein (UPF0127 family)
MRFCFKYKKKKVCLEVEECSGVMQGIGLTFRSKSSRALLFDFYKPVRMAITSLFVFFPFIAVWLDDKNRILEIKAVKPFTFVCRPKKRFTKLLEIPINSKYQEQLKIIRR